MLESRRDRHRCDGALWQLPGTGGRSSGAPVDLTDVVFGRL